MRRRGIFKQLLLISVAVSFAGCDASVKNSHGKDALTLTQEGAAPKAATATGAQVPVSGTNAASLARGFRSINNPKDVAYRIGPHDVLDVSVYRVAELSKTVQVAEVGTVNLPLVGELPVANRTARDVEHDLTRKLGAKYLQNPQVTVLVKEFNSQRVTLEGAVKVPGVYPLRGDMSLLQLIAQAKGLDDSSDSTIVIFRNRDGRRQGAKFDVAQIRSGGSRDPKLRAGDVVVAGHSAFKQGFNTLLKVVPLARFAILPF